MSEYYSLRTVSKYEVGVQKELKFQFCTTNLVSEYYGTRKKKVSKYSDGIKIILGNEILCLTAL